MTETVLTCPLCPYINFSFDGHMEHVNQTHGDELDRLTEIEYTAIEVAE